MKRFKSFHSSFPPPATSQFRPQITSYNQNRYQAPVAFNQQYHTIPPPIRAPIAHYQIPQAQVYTYPNQVPAYNYQTNQQQQYYYALNQQNQNVLPPQQYFAFQQQQQQLQQQANLIIQRPTYTNEVYQPAYQHPQQQLINAPQIKSEPQEQNQYFHPSNEASNVSQTPYFTNPIAFKQEPTDSLPVVSNNIKSENSNDDSNAFSIVTHLLKDKQILSQLEKVAQFQSFRHPNQNGSMYQDNWNFSTSSQSSSSSS